MSVPISQYQNLFTIRLGRSLHPNKKAILFRMTFAVPEMGVEPIRPNGHMALNHACLPIPAPGQKKS